MGLVVGTTSQWQGCIDKVNIVKIDDIIYLFILKFNKNKYDSKTNSIIIENKNYYGIY